MQHAPGADHVQTLLAGKLAGLTQGPQGGQLVGAPEEGVHLPAAEVDVPHGDAHGDLAALRAQLGLHRLGDQGHQLLPGNIPIDQGETPLSLAQRSSGIHSDTLVWGRGMTWALTTSPMRMAAV